MTFLLCSSYICRALQTRLSLSYLYHMSIQEIEHLSSAEKILLVERIWDSINKQEIPLTAAQRKELDRRLEKHHAGKNDYRNWEEVKQKLQNRR